MNLEDHLGDVIRKGRMISNVSAAVAAAAARISETELAALEESGCPPRRPDFRALARTIGMSEFKLASLADGWMPQPVQMDRWQHLQVLTSSEDGMSVNCFLTWDAATRQAALFDTGFDAQLVLDKVAAAQLDLAHLFVTHSHPDHVAGLGAIRTNYPKAKIHSSSKQAPKDQRNQAGEVISIGSLRVAHRETPGHAADGVTYVITGWPKDAPAVAIVGDTIFAGSMGRGNDGWELARSKVREQILTLPPETLVCPGHGPLTTVAEELAHNPFF